MEFGTYSVTRYQSGYSRVITLPSWSCSSMPRPQETDRGSFFANTAVPEYPFFSA